MINIRLYPHDRGTHVHCNVYTARADTAINAQALTHTKVGDLVFSREEWDEIILGASTIDNPYITIEVIE